MRVVFFGSPDFALPSLTALRSRHQVLAVVTQPDRPVGRGLLARASAVKRLALSAGLEVLTPTRLRGEFGERLRALEPEVLVVVAYGRILPAELLALPRLGAINVHGSLLPRHRGAAPVQAAILAGDRVTGVTTMQMDAGLDTGAILLAAETPIGEHETAGVLGERLARMGAELLIETLARCEEGSLRATAQDEGKATWAPKIQATDGHIDWSLGAVEIDRRVRAFSPWPGAVTALASGRRLKILQTRVGAAVAAGEPGEVLAADGAGIVIATGNGELVVLVAQPEARRAQSAADLVNGRQLQAGERLGV